MGVSPRDKTLRRVRQLLAATVAVAPVGACGYDVVDPMPAPARCAGTASRLFVRGEWELDRDGGAQPTLVLVIERPVDVSFVIDDVNIRGGVLLSKDAGPPMVLKIHPDATTKSGNITATVGVGCAGNQGKVQILALWGSADGGDPRPSVIVSVTDI